MDVLIFGRVVAGVGGAGVYVGVLTFLSSLTTATERPLYVGAIGLVWGSGAVLGYTAISRIRLQLLILAGKTSDWRSIR